MPDRRRGLTASCPNLFEDSEMFCLNLVGWGRSKPPLDTLRKREYKYIHDNVDNTALDRR
jgi:hypothetical protein